MSLDVSAARSEVQTAVYAVLTGDAGHAAKAATYDQPPQGAAFPYETIGEMQEATDDTFDAGFADIQFTIHTWSRYKGTKEVLDIQADQIRLLHRTQLSLATLQCVAVWKDYADVIQDPDGITRHGVIRFRVLVQSA